MNTAKANSPSGLVEIAELHGELLLEKTRVALLASELEHTKSVLRDVSRDSINNAAEVLRLRRMLERLYNAAVSVIPEHKLSRSIETVLDLVRAELTSGDE